MKLLLFKFVVLEEFGEIEPKIKKAHCMCSSSFKSPILNIIIIMSVASGIL